MAVVGARPPGDESYPAPGSAIYDIVITYKASDKLSFTTELNLINDSNFAANAYGAAQYVSYALNDKVALNGRAEIYRDEKGFFVAAAVSG